MDKFARNKELCEAYIKFCDTNKKCSDCKHDKTDCRLNFGYEYGQKKWTVEQDESPADEDYYLTTFRYKGQEHINVHELYFSKKYGWQVGPEPSTNKNRLEFEVLAWMPLPEPLEEGAE